MKKLCLVRVVLLIFCSCGKEPEPAVPPEEPENPILESVPESSEGESVPEEEPDEDSAELLGKAGNTEIYQKTVETGKTRFEFVMGSDGELNSRKEVPEIEHWITDKDGNPLIEHPFHEALLLHSDAIRGAAYEDAWAILGHYSGDYYRYYFIDGVFRLETETYEKSGECTLDIPGWDNEPFGYKRTRYCYNPYGRGYEGLNDSEGNLIFEPVHNGIGIPFADRFLLGSGTGDGSAAEEKVFTLVDAEGNIYVQFNIIRFTVFDDGSYIGIGWSAGHTEGFNACFDENGKSREKGFWFIDKNGNILSGRFERIEYGWNEEIASPDDIIIAFDENGNKVEIQAKDYCIKP